MKNNKIVCFLEEHLCAITVVCAFFIVLFGLFLIMTYLNSRELSSLKFQQKTSTSYYKVIGISLQHSLDGRTQYIATLSDDSMSEFSFPVTNSNCLKEGDIWAVQVTDYSCNKDTNLGFFTFITLGHNVWVKPNDLIRRNFKYFHQPLLSSEMQSYQIHVTNDYKNYLRGHLIIVLILSAVIELIIDMGIARYNSEY